MHIYGFVENHTFLEQFVIMGVPAQFIFLWLSWPSLMRGYETIAICIEPYTHFCRIKGCGGAPPPTIFERLKLPQQIICRRKENLSESPNHQKYWENIFVSRFYKQFSRNRRNLGHFRKFEKISNSKNMNILYIILKHVIWRFQIYNLFREIFKFREDESNNVFREIRKCFRKTAKFEFFAKQIITNI